VSGRHFSVEAAEQRLGPAAAAEARRSASEAPRFRPEQVEFLRALFASAVVLGRSRPASEAA
jgi:hypothetical protein